MYVSLCKVFAAVKIRISLTASADISRRLFHTNHASAGYILIKTLYLRLFELDSVLQWQCYYGGIYW